MKISSRFISLVLAAGFGAFFVGNDGALALASSATDTAGSVELFATDGGGTERHLLSHAGVISQLVVNPGQAVPVTLQFPDDKIGMSIGVDSLDGGEIASDQSTVQTTGQMVFTFRGNSPGLYRLLVHLPAEQYRLEIYVIDPNRPRQPSHPAMGN